jgi:riboflavin biosynthesis pyrimidine reductase
MSLGSGLRERGPRYLYTGFASSLDGRINVAGSWGPPAAIKNARDWRHVMELAMQGDGVLLSGSAVGQVRNGLLEMMDDLVEWRRGQGLADEPAIVVISRQGRFEVDDLARLGGRVVVVPGGPLPDDVAAAYEEAGIDVVVAGDDGRVDAARMLDGLAGIGLGILCSLAGPRVMAMLLPHLDALYLTLVGRLVGGEDYQTLLEGPLLDDAPVFNLGSAHVDDAGPDGSSQLFLEFLRA